jgi:hypothetical protein
VQGFVGASHALLFVEEISSINAARATGTAFAGNASLKGSITVNALPCLIGVVIIFKTGQAKGLALASLAVREGVIAEQTGNVIQVEGIWHAFNANIPVGALLTTTAEVPARNTLLLLHEGSVLAFGAALLERTPLAVLDQNRTLLASIVERIVEVGLALRAFLVISAKGAARDELGAILANVFLIDPVLFHAGEAMGGGRAGQTV